MREDHETERLTQTLRDNFAIGMTQMKMNRKLGATGQILRAIGTGTMLWYGGTLILHREMKIGELIAFYSWIGYLYDPTVRIVEFNVALQWAGAAVDRVFETLDTRAEIVDVPNAVSVGDMKGAVEFQNVSFGYDTDNLVVHDLSFKIEPGEIVAIVGGERRGQNHARQPHRSLL